MTLLTGKRAAFVDHYVGDGNFNATRSARLAGYKDGPGLRQTGHELLTFPDIREAIAERLRERCMSADECLARLAEQARSSMADFVEILPGGVDRDRWVSELVGMLKAKEPSFDAIQRHLKDEPTAEGWRLALQRARDAGMLHLVHRLSYDRQGRPQIELYSAQTALELIGKTHRLFAEKRILSGDPDHPLEVKSTGLGLSSATTEQLERIILALEGVESAGADGPAAGGETGAGAP